MSTIGRELEHMHRRRRGQHLYLVGFEILLVGFFFALIMQK